ncbi:unnamed protein product [Polarella glacialis]|uniref:Uncharacterized protein n=1 Tax=Polarella glacialis TaxID=89957 RepID=A0A813KDS1_POLGL|nr:unnamed protein product [Polarella glacialis]CAE8699248.1 unnamed protein product [Polarella glacialis]
MMHLPQVGLPAILACQHVALPALRHATSPRKDTAASKKSLRLAGVRDSNNNSCNNNSEGVKSNLRIVPRTPSDFTRRLKTNDLLTYFDTQVLRYDAERLTSTAGILAAAVTAASFVRTRRLLLTASLMTTVSCLASFVISAAAPWPYAFEAESRLLIDLTHSVRTVSVFLLGFYLASCLGRWWGMRDSIGGLWGALNDLNLLLAAYFPKDNPQDNEVRERILRWAVASHELMYKQACGDEDLDDLVASGLLEESECSVLAPLPSKGQVVWAWVAAYISHLAYGPVEEGGSRLPFAPTVMPELHRLCCKARGSLGATLAFVDTQIPFRYLHSLSLVVLMHNVIQAATSAVVISRAVRLKSPPMVVVELICLVFYTTIFTGMLKTGASMLNPLRSSGDVDFPRRAFSYFMMDENRAFHQGILNLSRPWQVPAASSHGAPQQEQREQRN